MTTESDSDWLKRQAEQIGARVRHVRLRNGISVQALADLCTEKVGYRMLRTTLANLESGLRKNVTVAEVSALAAALGVPPAALLFPVDQPDGIEVLPGVTKKPFSAWTWFTEASISFNVLENFTWDSSPAYTDFVEALQANILLRFSESKWMNMQGIIKKMQALADNDRPEERAAMEGAIAQTKTRQAAEARDAGEYYQRLKDQGLPTPDLPTEFENAILAELEVGKDG